MNSKTLGKTNGMHVPVVTFFHTFKSSREKHPMVFECTWDDLNTEEVWVCLGLFPIYSVQYQMTAEETQ